MKNLKTLGCLLALFMAAIILFPVTAKAADVAINAENFPDAAFRAYVKAEFDENGDGKLSAAECKNAGGIYVENKGITSLKGLEHFPNLEEIYCYGNSITSMDISGAPNIVLAYTDYWMEPDADGDGTLYYEHALFPEDWDDEDCDPDPSGFYRLWIDETTKVTIKKPVITGQPENKKVAPGKKASFTVKAIGDGTLKYQWYYKKPGASSWTAVAAASGKKATFSLTAEARHYGYKYRCKVTGPDGYRYSKTVTLTVKTKPVITSPTKAVTKTVKKGTTVKFTVKAQAAKTYQWYYRTSSKGEWKKVAAASGKTATYKMKAALKHKGYQYRCKVTNPYGYVFTKITTLKVTS